MSGYFARLAQRAGIGAAPASAPAPGAVAVTPLEQSVEIVAPPSERRAAAPGVADAPTAAPRPASKAAAEGRDEPADASYPAHTPLPTRHGQAVTAAPPPDAPAPDSEPSLARAMPAPKARDIAVAATRVAMPVAEQRTRPAGARAKAPAAATTDGTIDEGPVPAAAYPIDGTPRAVAARQPLPSVRTPGAPAPPADETGAPPAGPHIAAASGPVEVRIGTITLRVQPPPAPPPARPAAAAERSERFSPHRHYLRAW